METNKPQQAFAFIERSANPLTVSDYKNMEAFVPTEFKDIPTENTKNAPKGDIANVEIDRSASQSIPQEQAALPGESDALRPELAKEDQRAAALNAVSQDEKKPKIGLFGLFKRNRRL